MVKEGRSSAADARQLLTPGVLAVAVVLFAVYVLFDLREGGARASLLTTHLTGPGRYAGFYGPAWLTGMYVLDAILALCAAVLVGQSVRAIRQRLSGGGVGACSTGSTVLLGFFTFACPACPLPLLGSLGVTFFASALPLEGLEFKLLALLLVVGAVLWMRRRARQGAGHRSMAEPAR